MKDLISRQAAIDALMLWIEEHKDNAFCGCLFHWTGFKALLENLPSAQPERIFYANISDEEFERWLYEHGICNPNIHESIPCDAVPLLIDDAINELPTAELEIIRCKDCKHWNELLNICDRTKRLALGLNGFCSMAERRTDE